MIARGVMRAVALLLACALVEPAIARAPAGVTRATSTYADRCLEYGPVSLTGVLVRQTYPGPPDYESLVKGDEPRVVLILQLEQSVCVADPYSTSPRYYNEREIQLDLDGVYEKYRALLGKRIVATGALIHGGARHEKRLALAGVEVRRARAAP